MMKTFRCFTKKREVVNRQIYVKLICLIDALHNLSFMKDLLEIEVEIISRDVLSTHYGKPYQLMDHQ